MHRDGHFIDVSMTIAPIHVPPATPAAMVTISDITRRKEAEAALQKENHLRLAMDAAQMGMVLEVESVASRTPTGSPVLFGRSPDRPQVDYRAFNRAIHLEDRDLIAATLRHAINRAPTSRWTSRRVARRLSTGS